jgi:hypothetical protein
VSLDEGEGCTLLLGGALGPVRCGGITVLYRMHLGPLPDAHFAPFAAVAPLRYPWNGYCPIDTASGCLRVDAGLTDPRAQLTNSELSPASLRSSTGSKSPELLERRSPLLDARAELQSKRAPFRAGESHPFAQMRREPNTNQPKADTAIGTAAANATESELCSESVLEYYEVEWDAAGLGTLPAPTFGLQSVSGATLHVEQHMCTQDVQVVLRRPVFPDSSESRSPPSGYACDDDNRSEAITLGAFACPAPTEHAMVVGIGSFEWSHEPLLHGFFVTLLGRLVWSSLSAERSRATAASSALPGCSRHPYFTSSCRIARVNLEGGPACPFAYSPMNSASARERLVESMIKRLG